MPSSSSGLRPLQPHAPYGALWTLQRAARQAACGQTTVRFSVRTEARENSPLRCIYGSTMEAVRTSANFA